MAKKIIDLFAGCGGMSLGFQNAGFEIISAYDNWQPAIDIYSANFNHPIIKKRFIQRRYNRRNNKF